MTAAADLNINPQIKHTTPQLCHFSIIYILWYSYFELTFIFIFSG